MFEKRLGSKKTRPFTDDFKVSAKADEEFSINGHFFSPNCGTPLPNKNVLPWITEPKSSLAQDCRPESSSSHRAYVRLLQRRKKVFAQCLRQENGEDERCHCCQQTAFMSIRRFFSDFCSTIVYRSFLLLLELPNKNCPLSLRFSITIHFEKSWSKTGICEKQTHDWTLTDHEPMLRYLFVIFHSMLQPDPLKNAWRL